MDYVAELNEQHRLRCPKYIFSARITNEGVTCTVHWGQWRERATGATVDEARQKAARAMLANIQKSNE
jgi:hypothetical protein